MVQPKFVCITTHAIPKSRRSAEHRGPVATYWRLVAANNRPLGRAPSSFTSVAECVSAVERLRASSSQLDSQTSTVPGTGQWTWTADVGGVVVATSSREFLRHRECVHNYRLFREALSQAVGCSVLSRRSWLRVPHGADRAGT